MKQAVNEIVARAAEREIVIYGCGECAQIMLSMLSIYNVDVSFFVDQRHLFYKSMFG